MAKILDIGCGKKKLVSKGNEVVGLDIVNLPGVDVVHNLDKYPWPFKKNEFDIIVANHVLEHVSDLIISIEEIARILKSGGILKGRVPYHSSIGAFTDPTHKIFFAYRTFDYFSNSSSDFNFYTKTRFEILKRKLVFHSYVKFLEPIFNYFPRFYERFFRYLFPAEEIHFELKVIK